MSKRILVIVASVVVVFLAASCGGGKKAAAPTDSNYGLRRAVTDALARDAQIRAAEASMIQSVKAGQLPLNAGLDTLVDDNRAILALIGSLNAAGKGSSADLASARDTLSEYLRNRVHQLEAAMVATTPADLETMYARSEADLAAARAQVESLLLKYDPSLKSTLPQ